MSHKKKGNKKNKPNIPGVFTEKNWNSWTNQQRLDWVRNFRDKARDVYREQLEITDEEIARLDQIVNQLEQILAAEKAAAIVGNASLVREYNRAMDNIFSAFDQSGKTSWYQPPNDKKKGN